MCLKNRKEKFVYGKTFKQSTVLIVGGGHSGLNVAVRLKLMGIDSLIVDKNFGHNWRNS